MRSKSFRLLLAVGLFLAAAPATHATDVARQEVNAGAKALVPGVTRLISISVSGGPANDFSYDPSVSTDGRFVVFGSYARNLVEPSPDRPGEAYAYVRDRRHAKTMLVSRSQQGRAVPISDDSAVSAHGRFVAFSSLEPDVAAGDSRNGVDVFVRDRRAHTTELISQSYNGERVRGDSGYGGIDISAHGRFVTFTSSSRNLVPHDTNRFIDVFVYDRSTDQTERISVSNSGKQAHGTSLRPAISGNGRYVAFASEAPNLVRGDTNDSTDVFVRDRALNRTFVVTRTSAGETANGASTNPSISSDGSLVTFSSEARNLAKADSNSRYDIYLWARSTGRVALLTRGLRGHPADGHSYESGLSPQGRYVAFTSSATNLVRRDVNGRQDVFLLDRRTDDISLISVSSDGKRADASSDSPSVSAGGRITAFRSRAANLAAPDRDHALDVFIRIRG